MLSIYTELILLVFSCETLVSFFIKIILVKLSKNILFFQNNSYNIFTCCITILQYNMFKLLIEKINKNKVFVK